MADGPIPPERSVLIANLSADKKRKLWNWIKGNDPATASFIQSPEVAQLTAEFSGSSVVLDIDYVQRALRSAS